MSNLIDRQAAIDDLHGKDPSQIWDTADIEVWVNGLPSAQPEPYEDTVSRAEAKRILFDFAGCIVDTPNGIYQQAYKKYNDMMDNLPCVTPKPKTGRWEDVSPEYHTGMGIVYRCNTCKGYYTTSPRQMHYCPNCGAKMEG